VIVAGLDCLRYKTVPVEGCVVRDFEQMRLQSAIVMECGWNVDCTSLARGLVREQARLVQARLV